MDDEARAGGSHVGGGREVVVGEIILVGSTREELAHLDRGPAGLGPVNRDPIVEAAIRSTLLEISEKFAAMDREAEAQFGPLPKYEIPKCKGGGCELVWALKTHLANLRGRDRERARSRVR